MSIPPVDPTKRQNAAVRTVRGFIKTRPGTWLARHLASRVDPVLLKLSGGRLKAAVGFPTVNVTTKGRKSGQPRTSTLLYFTRGDDVILIASSYGDAKHPAWYLNLKADPEAELVCRGRAARYRVVREAEGAEREELYGLARRMYGGYETYESKAGERRIPVLVLQPA